MKQLACDPKDGFDETLGCLLRDHPTALGLYFLALPHMDYYGVMRGDAVLIMNRVACYADLSEGAVNDALDALERADLITRYEDGDGNPMIYFTRYPKLVKGQSLKRVGPPKEELPPDWEPIPEMYQAVVSHVADPAERRAAWEHFLNINRDNRGVLHGGQSYGDTVYFIYDAAARLVKIGVANNVNARLQALQVKAKGKLSILGTIPGGGTKLESYLHQHLADYRVHGEWFDITPEWVSQTLAVYAKTAGDAA